MSKIFNPANNSQQRGSNYWLPTTDQNISLLQPNTRKFPIFNNVLGPVPYSDEDTESVYCGQKRKPWAAEVRKRHFNIQ